VLKETYSSGSYTESTIADGGLSWPTEIAVDGNGNVYFADYFNSRVLKETYSSGSYTQSVIPTGSPLGNTFGVAVDGSGNVYISDVSNTRVLKEDFAGAPPSLSFASTNVGSTSSDSPQTVTVLNFGSAALTAVAPGLTLPADFTLATGSGTPPDCTSSFSLAANASCNLSIDFFPTTTGTLSETLTLTDNSLNASSATQSITLNGTGIGSVGPPPPTTPTITWATPAPITYGTPLNGVQLNAVASVDGTYVYSPVAETIPIVGSDALSVTFYPSDSIDYTTATATVYLTVNQPTTTTTTLALSSALVSSGTVVTFTATVSNGSAVTTGLVTFCDATAAYCENSAIIGTAQLTSAGTAVIKLVPGIGSHSYKAVFGGNTTSLKSTSSAQALVVTGTFPTATAISSSGSAGSYTLTGTVVGTGSASLSPTGTVSFLDTSNGNAVLGSQTLGSGVAALSFANSSTPAVGNEPAAVTVGDFNGDGKADLAVANGSSGTVTVLLGNGDGTFTAAAGSPITVGSRPVSVAVGDFNGDGKADLAVANYVDNTVTVLLGNGDGTFTAAGSPIVVGNGPESVVVGDFNGDGKADLAVANNGDNTVTVLLGNGDGTFTAAGSPIVVGNGATSVAVGDFNGDGKADLAVANYVDNTVTVLLGNGDGTFTPAAGSPIVVGNGPGSVVVGDFNGDSKSDLAVANNGDNTVTVLLGNGDGTFTAAGSPIVVGNGATSVAVGDFNGDGKADLAVANYGSGTLTVLLGNGDGTFAAAAGSPITVGNNASAVAAGDFNGDGKADLAVANWGDNTVTVLLAQVTETATAAISGVSIPGAGTHNVDASYAGDSNFGASTSSTIPLTGTASQTTPMITWATPAAITYGTALSATQLDANSGGVAGAFVYNPLAGSTPATGTDTLSVTFTPSDTTDYTTATQTVSLTVNKATPLITWATPAAITYGTALSATQLDANSGGVAGAFVYNPAAGTTPAAGTDTLSVTFTPSDTTDYTTATQTVSLTVNKATPLITWAMPAAITYGTALSSTQLNATASVPGTFVYNPAAGTTPAAGTDTLSVTFTPTDTTDYTTATASVTLTVNSGSRTTPTITWATPAAISSGTALSRAQLNATASVPGTFVYNPLAGSIPATGTDTLSVTFTPTDTTDNTTTTATVVLTVGDFFGLNSTGLSSQMVAPGGAAVYTLTVQPKGMATLPGVVTFSATGLPPGATAVFSPTTIPAGSTTTAVTLTIQTSALLTKNARTRGLAALGMMLLPLFGMISSRKRARRVRYLLAVVLLGVFSLGTVMGLAGCAGGSGGNQPPLSSTTYTIVVTATCGKLQHATNLTLVVHN
jgi:hypothetical protein